MHSYSRKRLNKRLNALQSAIDSCWHADAGSGELAALFCVARDMQPGLCEILAELSEDQDWREAYKERIMSEEEQRATGHYLWEGEEEGS
jgi:hypothetical protein